MPSAVEQTEAPNEPIKPNFMDLILGSTLVKGSVALAGIVVMALLTVGWNSYLVEAASKNADVVATQGKVAVLGTEMAQLKSTADAHSIQLQFIASDQQRNAALQSKIFDALKSLGADLQNVDKHLSAVDAHVSDQADQIRELRSERK
jgi:preprotein translocase subunit SecF